MVTNILKKKISVNEIIFLIENLIELVTLKLNSVNFENNTEKIYSKSKKIEKNYKIQVIKEIFMKNLKFHLRIKYFFFVEEFMN